MAKSHASQDTARDHLRTSLRSKLDSQEAYSTRLPCEASRDRPPTHKASFPLEIWAGCRWSLASTCERFLSSHITSANGQPPSQTRPQRRDPRETPGVRPVGRGTRGPTPPPCTTCAVGRAQCCDATISPILGAKFFFADFISHREKISRIVRRPLIKSLVS